MSNLPASIHKPIKHVRKKTLYSAIQLIVANIVSQKIHYLSMFSSKTLSQKCTELGWGI